ncbi:MAG: lysylphosphatidylglycerol synthase transmembrane domain-containing protein [Candidatus Promineifilaceae bacterium]
MLIDTQSQPLQPNRSRPSRWRIAIGLLLTILTLWFVQRTLSWSALQSALNTVDWRLFLLGLASIVATIGLKTVRWRLLFRPKQSAPPLYPAFNALMLNQFINLVFFLRVGELGRMAYIGRNSADAAQALGTIIVEKWLELLAALLTMLGLLTWLVVLPDGIDQRATRYAAIVLGLLGILYLLAFQNTHIVSIVSRIYKRFPPKWEARLHQATVAGLQGLATLREPRAVALQLLLSFGVMLLYISTPYILFIAFGLPYTLFDAAVLHTGIGLVAAIPSTPGKFGLIEVSTLAILQFLNPSVPETQLLSYAIIFHLTIIIPPLIWGGMVALRFNWAWKTQ